MTDIIQWLGDPEQYPNVLISSMYRRMYRKSSVGITDDTLRSYLINKIKSSTVSMKDLVEPTSIMIMINPDEATWNSDNVMRARDFMITTMETEITREDIIRHGIGELTNNNIKSYGILACYKYCLMNSITLDIDISAEGIYNSARLLLYDKMTLISYLMTCDTSHIINTLARQNMNKGHVRHDRLILMSKLVNEIYHKDMEKEYYIAWASLRLNINLYDFEFPYTAITMFPDYTSYESKSSKGLSLKDTFEPRLPYECYNISALKNIALNEGLEISSDNKKIYYDAIVKQRNEKTFYKGKHNNVNDCSPINYNDIDEIPEEQLVSYGTYYNTICIPILELDEHLNYTKDFIDMDGYEYSKESINKLIRMSNVTPKNDIFLHLLDTIMNVKNRLDKLNIHDRDFITYYKNHRDKDMISQFMLKCLHCSMYMRGWDGISPNTYPLDGNTNLGESSIFSNVSVSLASIKEFEAEHPEIYDKIMNLDLYAIDNKTGINIWKRDSRSILRSKFSIISDNNPDNVESCIRTNSNWILGTIYHYSDLISISYGFDMTQVRFIF